MLLTVRLKMQIMKHTTYQGMPFAQIPVAKSKNVVDGVSASRATPVQMRPRAQQWNAVEHARSYRLRLTKSLGRLGHMVNPSILGYIRDMMVNDVHLLHRLDFIHGGTYI
jgi:hypothetical protein